MKNTEFQIAQITHDIIYNSIGDVREFYHQVRVLRSWMFTMGYKQIDGNYKYGSSYYGDKFLNINGTTVTVDWLHDTNVTINISIVRTIIKQAIEGCSDDVNAVEAPPTDTTKDIFDLQSYNISGDAIESAITNIAKDLRSLGDMIDWLNKCGYQPQINRDPQTNGVIIVIKSPFVDTTFTGAYDFSYCNILRFVVLDQHIRDVAIRLAKSTTTNDDVTNFPLEQLANRYGWTYHHISDKDKWGWVKNGILYKLPYDVDDLMNTHASVIHVIMERIQLTAK